ncbi:MAG: peptidyl-prolyl cis-trans isomerase, partial [Terriglobales bacterium]
MLNFFRRKDAAARYMLGGILVIISVAMVLFLVPGIAGGGGGPIGSGNSSAVATVDGRQISTTELTNAISRIEQTEQLPAEYLPYFGQQILNSLIMHHALGDQARRYGLSASSSDIATLIRENLPQLFPNGVFVGETEYADFIQQTQQMTVAAFEQQVRTQVLINKLRDLVTDGIRVTPAEVRAEFLRNNDQAVFQYAVLDPSQLRSQVTATPAELQAYYQAHQATYEAPERRGLELVLANLGQFAARVQPTAAQVRQYYQAHLAQYTFPERVQLAHILLKTSGDSAAQLAQAQQQAAKIEKQLRSGAKFAALAKQHSQDDATASQGGEIGWVTAGRLYPAVEKAAFALPAGQVSSVIATPYGLEILRVEAHQAAHVEPLTQEQGQIVSQIQQAQAAQMAQNAINQAQVQATAKPLAQVAAALGLQYIAIPPVSTTDPITGIGINPQFESDVFGANLHDLTPVVQVPAGYAFARVTTIKPAAPQPFSQVQAQVEQAYRQQAAAKLAAQQGQALAAAARKEGLKQAAAKMHV